MTRDRKPRRRTIWVISLCCALAGLALIGLQLNRTQLWEDREVYAGWRVQNHVFTDSCRLLDREQAERMNGRDGDCSAALARARVEHGLKPSNWHLVLLLHGMGRSPFVFREMERALRQAGYEAVAISYPSLTRGIAGHAAQLEDILDTAEDMDTVSFVTHSLGGLVVRTALARESAWRERLALGRVVMIAPPSQGSELAEALDDWWLFRLVGGPSAAEIAEGGPFPALPAGLEFAVIAGGTADGEGYNKILSANNDGVVTVEETRLHGARDFLVVPAVHTFIAAEPETIAATRKFLETGRLR